MQSKRNQIDIASSHGDIERLYYLYQLSRTEESGKEVRDYITDHLAGIAANVGLPPVKSFKQLLEDYDRREYRRIIQSGNMDRIVDLLVEVVESKGTRMATLVGEAAFEDKDHLPDMEVGAWILVDLVDKMGLFPGLEGYLQRYGTQEYTVDPEFVEFIARALVDGDKKQTEKVFESVLNEIQKGLGRIFMNSLRRYRREHQY